MQNEQNCVTNESRQTLYTGKNRTFVRSLLSTESFNIPHNDFSICTVMKNLRIHWNNIVLELSIRI